MNIAKAITKHGKACLAVIELCEEVFTQKELEDMDYLFADQNWWGLLHHVVLERMNSEMRKYIPERPTSKAQMKAPK